MKGRWLGYQFKAKQRTNGPKPDLEVPVTAASLIKREAAQENAELWFSAFVKTFSTYPSWK